MKKIYCVLGLFFVVLLFAGCATEKVENVDAPAGDAVGGLTDSEKDALYRAINDEYKAHATYVKVVSKFGEVRPFSNIVKSEEVHINELNVLYEEYGLDVPVDDWTAKVPEFESLGDACAAAAQAEIDNADMYDELLGMVEKEDIKLTFIALRDASRNNHLPAFQRCGGQ